MLKDLLKTNLKLVICGTAAGTESARKAEYYAGRGNKMWKALFETGLTDIELEPSKYRLLIDYNIGLTDVIKGQSGMDSEIDFRKANIREFELKILKFSPGVVCFNGKKAAQTYFQNKKVDYGLQEMSIGKTKVFVAPSTSGAASGFWDVSKWHKLAQLVRSADKK